MKKKLLRTLSLAFALLLVLGALASCGIGGKNDGTLGKRSPKFNDVYLETPKTGSGDAVTSHALVTALSGATDVKASGALVCYKNASGKVCVYSSASDRVILELPTESVSSTAAVALLGDFIRVSMGVGESAETKVYGDTGALLATASGEHDVLGIAGGFILDGKLYRVKDGALGKTYTVPPFVNLSTTSYGERYEFTDEYLVHVKDTDVVYYDENFEVAAHYNLPDAGVFSYDFKLLSNGNLFVQYAQYCDVLAKDYDFYRYTTDGGMFKCRQTVLVFHPENGKTKTVDTDGVMVVSLWAEVTDSYGFTDRVKNVLSYRSVNGDGHIENETRYVAMDDNGKLGVSLDGFIKGQEGLISPMNSSYYYVKTETGYAILNTKGEVVRTAPAIGTAKEYGYLHNNMIYDEDFDLVVNLDGDNTVALSTANSAIAVYYRTVGSQERYYVYTKNGEREILPPDGYEFYEYAYQPVSVVNGCVRAEYKTVSGNSYLYEYSTFDGTLLFRARSSAAFLADNLVRYVSESGETVYARLS